MRFIPKDSVLSQKIESLSKIPTENTKTQWELEFSKRWVAAGAHWGVPKTTLAVHGWLMAQPQPVSTDEVMSALELSRGGAPLAAKQPCSDNERTLDRQPPRDQIERSNNTAGQWESG